MHFQNYHLHEYGDEILAVRDNVECSADLFRLTGETRNVRTAAIADAVLYDGGLLSAYSTPQGTVVFQDPYAGVREEFFPPEWFDEPVPTFEEIDSIGQDDRVDFGSQEVGEA